MGSWSAESDARWWKEVWSLTEVADVDIAKAGCIKEDAALRCLVEASFRNDLIVWCWICTRRGFLHILLSNGSATASEQNEILLSDRPVQVPEAHWIFICSQEVLTVGRQRQRMQILLLLSQISVHQFTCFACVTMLGLWHSDTLASLEIAESRLSLLIVNFTDLEKSNLSRICSETRILLHFRQPANIIHRVRNFLVRQHIDLFLVRLELTKVLERLLLIALSLLSFKENAATSMITHCKKFSCRVKGHCW